MSREERQEKNLGHPQSTTHTGKEEVNEIEVVVPVLRQCSRRVEEDQIKGLQLISQEPIAVSEG